MSQENANQTGSISLEKVTAAIEAILYAAGHPVEYAKLSEVLGLSPKDVKNIVEAMSRDYNSEKIQPRNSAPYISRLLPICHKRRVSSLHKRGARNQEERYSLHFVAGGARHRGVQPARHPCIRGYPAPCGFLLCNEQPHRQRSYRVQGTP